VKRLRKKDEKIITLTTDFGLTDPYVAEGLPPAAFDLPQAPLLLWGSSAYLEVAVNLGNADPLPERTA
jgi:S-adenosylmethionine hydrolase